MSDVMQFLFQLDQLKELGFSIDVKRPPNHDGWECSITFNGKDYSSYVDISQYRDRNPNKYDRNKFSKEEVERVWTMKDDPYYQIVLMLLYNGCRISEFLDLKKENVHLDEQYFDVIASKTENGLRKVPIPDKLLPFYKDWYNRFPECEYLLANPEGKHFLYRNYKDSYYTTIMEQIGISWSPHCTRHTTISMMKEHSIDETIIKKIVGHSGAMTLTERVYTHLDVQILIDAVNKFPPRFWTSHPTKYRLTSKEKPQKHVVSEVL